MLITALLAVSYLKTFFEVTTLLLFASVNARSNFRTFGFISVLFYETLSESSIADTFKSDITEQLTVDGRVKTSPQQFGKTTQSQTTTTTDNSPIIEISIEITVQLATKLPINQMRFGSTAQSTTEFPVTGMSTESTTALPTTKFPVTGMSTESTALPTTKFAVIGLSTESTALPTTKFADIGLSTESTALPTTQFAVIGLSTESTVQPTTELPVTEISIDTTAQPLTTETIKTTTEHLHTTVLDDILIAVKTSKQFQTNRLDVIFRTWFQLAKHQTWFFSDGINDRVWVHNKTFTDQHVINTNCSFSHSIEDLCCKTSAELDFFYESGKRWFCHFDDDNYVNVPRLVEVLQEYDHNKDWYLGRNSQGWKTYYDLPYRFATFGAGMCITRSLILKINAFLTREKLGKNFYDNCTSPDDLSFGLLVAQATGKNLTIVPEFHSHIELLPFITKERFNQQISFSYEDNNTVTIDGFSIEDDPTRFLSLHCYLFPYFKYCLKRVLVNV